MSKTTHLSSQITCQILLAILIFALPFHANSQTPKSSPEEQTILLKLKQQWLNPPSLSHWTSSSDHCTWPEITCTNGSVTKINAPNLAITETIPPFICNLKNLAILDLNTNNISGLFPTVLYNCSKLEYLDLSQNLFIGTIPDDIDRLSPGRLQYLYLEANNFTGDIPSSIGKLTGLKRLYARQNLFNGSFPAEIGNLLNLEELALSTNDFAPQALPSSFTRLTKLRYLWMTQNNLIGEIPQNFGNMTTLEQLDLSENSLSGKIPRELTSLPELETLLLDSNLFSGSLPSSIISWKRLNILDFRKNRISGQIPAAIGLLPVLNDLDLSENEFSGEIPAQIGLLKLSSLNLSSNRLSGRIPVEFENAVFDRSFLDNPGLCSGNPSLGLNPCAYKTRKSNKLSSKIVAAVSSIAAVGLLVALVYTFFLIRGYKKKKQGLDSTWKLTSFQKLDFTETSILSSLTESNVIGSGGSGKVYRVPINDSGTCVAVKKICNSNRLNAKLEKQFRAEVEILGNIRHRNIVKLLCCISDESSKLLVYEYLENCSLDRWLHYKRRSSRNTGSTHHIVLDWPRRLQIAIASARGLCYMHHDLSPPIIHRDVKSSNILLDSEFNAKIADFGLARTLVKVGKPNTMSIVAGSFGFIAPEYPQTGRANEKIDVYSFGVVLLELVTGREGNEGDENSSLAEWARRHFQGGKPIVDALDVDIKEPCYLDEITKVFRLGIFCTSLVPADRPTMREVLQILLRPVHSPPLGERMAEVSVMLPPY